MAKILIVDDYEDNRLLLSGIITALGYESIHAENGEDALTALRKNKIDLIFMDIEMPVLNGIDAADEIRNTFMPPKSEVPIVAITAHHESNFSEELKNGNFTDILSKPYTIVKIQEMLKRFIK